MTAYGRARVRPRTLYRLPGDIKWLTKNTL